MTSKFRPAGSGWAIIVLSLTALALAGCGRKGPLDLPPTATNAPTANGAAPVDTETAAQKTSSMFNPTSASGADAEPAAAKGRKKPFILDSLLDEPPGKK
ncbi:LPS translocon maturation chaperone LptM [Bradyrhizobium sp. 195]|uniref:LPS translocon maturation chaperone LptM n=1 Tax=Bradyrhizobium sp. 195 TaxID=2782662 RepID=UPI0020010546|nr:lipoprotein [Bradyrhizobium sp. 195]UPK26329.1 lipoprotein [Bradyrhizobium sp. 195]